MNSRWKPWLPEGALSDGTADRLLDGTLVQWSDKWFAGPGMRPLARLTRGGAVEMAQGQDGQWHFSDEGVAVSVPENSRLALAGMMLDAPAPTGTMTPADRQVVDRLVTGCIDDLCARVAKMLKLPSGARWRTGQAAALRFEEARFCDLGVDDREPLFRIFLEAHLVAGMVKGALPVPEPRPMGSVAEGLTKQSVTISALLGRCQLTLSELTGVSEGDVLVLDRELTRPLDLALDGQVKSGTCTLEQEGGELRLKILKPISG